MFLLKPKIFGILFDMYLNTLAPATKKLLGQISKNNWLKKYYLAGGTALSLQYGHRTSIDLDWFTEINFSTKLLLAKLKKVGIFKLLNEEENTVEGYLNDVKLSFMTYPYSLLKKKIKFFENVYLADKLDIALMKLTAISHRNTKKDFIDLYLYLHKENTNISGLFAEMKKKYSGVEYDPMHICKSLVYFYEADREPMPKMLEKISWEDIKAYFNKEIRKIV